MILRTLFFISVVAGFFCRWLRDNNVQHTYSRPTNGGECEIN